METKDISIDRCRHFTPSTRLESKLAWLDKHPGVIKHLGVVIQQLASMRRGMKIDYLTPLIE